jgi:phosphatidylglycerol:prolipoprotein diacylglycerol transferase
VGRLGCFLNGCCYGKPTAAWCGVVFPGQPHAVLPTQLFEAIGLLGIYAALRALQRRGALALRGRVTGWYLLAYGALRFVLEFLRGDQPPWRMGLTLQQFISIGMVLGGMTLVRLSRLAR